VWCVSHIFFFSFLFFFVLQQPYAPLILSGYFSPDQTSVVQNVSDHSESDDESLSSDHKSKSENDSQLEKARKKLREHNSFVLENLFFFCCLSDMEISTSAIRAHWRN
jgi:hypothetical protein